jgi:hypothetical protein
MQVNVAVQFSANFAIVKYVVSSFSSCGAHRNVTDYSCGPASKALHFLLPESFTPAQVKIWPPAS